ncbi:MAG: beta-ketoacyl-[acyl-carrier-protein] synthase family protein [Phycisphaerales bacterium]|jgi:3-oxoacyl-[acyl-carrier-protein] synthase II|nr:beta-ketoacyl-[acyl-carrier-protein] synthase family protein [Phycisphaerales bacterium]
MPDRRAVVTGLGVASAAGTGAQEFWETLIAGEKRLAANAIFDPAGFPCHAAGQIENLSARKVVPKSYRKATKVMARDIEVAVVAADLAFKDAEIATKADGEMSIEAGRLGCNVGAGLICCELDELGQAAKTSVTDGKFDMKTWGDTGMTNLTPLWLLKYLPNMLSCHVTIIHGAEGPSNCITCGATSGILSIAEAARWVARGAADVVIAGGAEAKLTPLGVLRQSLLERLSSDSNDTPESACKPFDAAHSGTVMGEGGGLMIIEDADRAKQRGAKVYAEIAGFGAACDPNGINVTEPNCGSLDLAVSKAIADAGITADDIDLIVAQGTGVPGEDRCEAAAWEKVFGDNLPNVPAMAVTGTTGTMFAGQSGVTMVAGALALQHQSVAPTVNFTTPDEGCRLSLSGEARKCDINYVVVGAFSVGGQSAACVLKRCEA